MSYTGPAAARQAPQARRLSRPCRVHGAAGTASQTSGPRFMAAQRMMHELRKVLASARCDSAAAGNPVAVGDQFGRQLRLAAGLVVLAIPLSGCGTGSLWDKFLAKDDTFVEEPADKLYNEGLYLMNQRKDAKAASKKFEEVDRQHPYSDWARKSLLMSAYAFYNSGDYDSCIGAATRYVTLHPGSPDAAYAQYLIAASHYDQIPDTSRDQGRTEKAIAALEEVIRKYPTSEYANSAKAKLEGARDQLADRHFIAGKLIARAFELGIGAVGVFRRRIFANHFLKRGDRLLGPALVAGSVRNLVVMRGGDQILRVGGVGAAGMQGDVTGRGADAAVVVAGIV